MATVVANTARLLAAAREAGAQPVLVRVSLYPDAADRLNPPADQQGRMPGSLPPEWSELLPELDCKPGEIVITKRQWGGFYGTDLELQLRRRGLATIVLCGVATEFGVESTARDAYERGFHLVFAADAMTGTHPDSHSNSIDRIFPRIGRVRSTDEIIAALQP
jgi:nicotinamidase-related amidase